MDRARAVLAILVVLPALLRAQGQVPPPAQVPSPRAAAPIDLTGQWVSVVTEDWRWRMLTPRKGDYTSVPLNAAGRVTADAWDPANGAGDGCKPFGGAAIMRVPGRLRITWDTDAVLKIETDAGQQVRRLRFDRSQPDAPARTWQGVSRAQWEPAGGGARGRGDALLPIVAAARRGGSLTVVTTNMRAGYLRANGVPYSEGATLTEYFDRHGAFGSDWLTVTTVVDDPTYLQQPFITSSDFKRETDGSQFRPVRCE